MRRETLLAVLAFVCPRPVRAQIPNGSEFVVNTFTTLFQRVPSVAADASGDFVVVWHSRPQDGSGYGIFGQRFNTAGAPRGIEFQVNTYTTGYQRYPRVASSASGRFVVVWQSAGQDGSGYGIRARRYDTTGASLGAEIPVNAYTTGAQTKPSVAVDAAGNFVVAWTSAGQDGNLEGVFARRFNAAGGAVGGEFQVNTTTFSVQSYPAVAWRPGGGFVVVWSSFSQDYLNSWAVIGRRFNAAGQAEGAEFVVNGYTTSEQLLPSVTPAGNGELVVAWQSYTQDGEAFGIFGRGLDSTGLPQGAEFPINTHTTLHQRIPAVSADANGNFVVVWASQNQDGDGYGIFGQMFDAGGTPSGIEFRVNSYTTNEQRTPAVASNSAGDFVVVWSGPGDGNNDGILAQRFGDLIFRDGF
jgi:hypothetical protein